MFTLLLMNATHFLRVFFLFFVFCFWSPARFRHLLIHEKKGKKFLCRMDGTLTHSPTHNFL